MEKVKYMEQGTWFSAMWGAIGGTTYYIFVDAMFLFKVLEAGVIAFVCGLSGAAAKHLYDKYINKKKRA